ncbi:uncharacterized protein LOC122392834 [Amphibalanus amphitrite]|uniref:uncharacterized protein LOC122392834 n=1 Tax=Amphibalanus amphitrite TaxID=1232801 RepID=UPI001C916E3C|nr:uncharacterized protein LOC122392834 [Amphibalanus amphitrite]
MNVTGATSNVSARLSISSSIIGLLAAYLNISGALVNASSAPRTSSNLSDFASSTATHHNLTGVSSGAALSSSPFIRINSSVSAVNHYNVTSALPHHSNISSNLVANHSSYPGNPTDLFNIITNITSTPHSHNIPKNATNSSTVSSSLLNYYNISDIVSGNISTSKTPARHSSVSGNLTGKEGKSTETSNIVNIASQPSHTPGISNNFSNITNSSTDTSQNITDKPPKSNEANPDTGDKARLVFTSSIIAAIWASSLPPAAAIWRNCHLHRASYFYVMALCLLDCFLGCSIGAMVVTIVIYQGISDAPCLVFEALVNGTMHTISALMLALSRDRFRSVRDPIGYRAAVRRSVVWRHLALAVLYGLTLGGGAFVASRRYLGSGLQLYTPLCDTFDWLLDPLNRPVALVSVSGNIVVDFGTIVYNARIMRCAWKVTKSVCIGYKVRWHGLSSIGSQLTKLARRPSATVTSPFASQPVTNAAQHSRQDPWPYCVVYSCVIRVVAGLTGLLSTRSAAQFMSH